MPVSCNFAASELLHIHFDYQVSSKSPSTTFVRPRLSQKLLRNPQLSKSRAIVRHRPIPTTIMVCLSVLFSLAAPLLAAASSSVLNLNPSNFDSVVFESGKPALVEFFAPWCGHCKTLAPIYEELATAFASSGSKVSIANVDADDHKSLGKRFGVQGFPTLKWFDGKKGSEPEDYNGGRDLESLTKFISDKTGIKSKTPKAAPSHVEMLTDTTFKQEIGGDKDVLVAFTAPWCGRTLSQSPS
jgi:protein disulfide-isomerase A6